MTFIRQKFKALEAAAYETAWLQFNSFGGLTPDEKAAGPRKLQEYIRMMIQAGERDAEKISQMALGLLRQQEQISRSKAVIEMSVNYDNSRQPT
jgi:hypothetical protein